MKLVKQFTCEGCLPACFLTLINKKVTLSSELRLLTGGFKESRESYAIGIAAEFTTKYGRKVTVLVHNRYFYKKLKSLPESSVLKLQYSQINLKLLNKLECPFILYIDNSILTKSVHWPHFIIIERRYKNKFVLIDPWSGGRRWLTENKLMKAVLSLKNYLKFCPLVIIVE